MNHTNLAAFAALRGTQGITLALTLVFARTVSTIVPEEHSKYTPVSVKRRFAFTNSSATDTGTSSMSACVYAETKMEPSGSR
jgi:hypothetical protein